MCCVCVCVFLFVCEVVTVFPVTPRILTSFPPHPASFCSRLPPLHSGLIAGSVGGTPIEAWLPAGVLGAQCPADTPPCDKGVNDTSLYTAFIEPFAPYTLAGVLCVPAPPHTLAPACAASIPRSAQSRAECQPQPPTSAPLPVQVGPRRA